MMPGYPVPHLIVPQAGLPLGPLKTLLDPMRRLGHAGQFLQRHVRSRHSTNNNHACRCHPLDAPASRTAAPRDLFHLCSVRAWTRHFTASITSGPFSPSRTSILVQASSGSAAHQRSTRTNGVLGCGPRPEYSGGGASRSRISVFEGTASRYRSPRVTQFQAKTAGTAHLVVARDPGVRQHPSAFRQHLQCQLMAGLKLDRLGHSGLLATRPVLGPFLRKIKTYIDDRMFFPRDVSHVDAHLAVLDLAEPAAPLLGDAHRLGPFLGKRRGVEHDHAVGFAQLLADLGCQCLSNG